MAAAAVGRAEAEWGKGLQKMGRDVTFVFSGLGGGGKKRETGNGQREDMKQRKKNKKKTLHTHRDGPRAPRHNHKTQADKNPYHQPTAAGRNLI